MANENETVEQVHDNLAEIGAHDRECPPLASVLTHHRFHGRKQIKEIGDEDWYFGVVDPCVLLFVCDRFLAAHKREIAERDGERKGILRANEQFAADNTRLRGEIAEKDAEIASLKDKNTEAFKAVLKRDALIRELADALKKIDDACDGDMCKHFIDTEQCSKCKYLETCQTGIAHNALKTNESEIAKALEGCK